MNDIRGDKLYVALTFDIDGETLWTSRDKINRIGPVLLSQGYYGPETGVPRILKLLKAHNLPATFFITGYAADTYPDICKTIVDAGHEIGHHNYAHEWPPRTAPAEERAAFEKGLDSLTRLTGKQPEGYRAPGWEFSDITFDLLKEFGMAYSSNMMDDEFAYQHTEGGQPTGIWELPCSWILDDAAFFMYGLTYGPPQYPTGPVLDLWNSEFDGMYAEGDGRVYVLTMHPQFIGRSSRIAMLNEFITRIKDKPGVVFTGCGDYVRKLRQADSPRRRDYDRRKKPV
ncbi:MAG: polysaccharide deacetylase [Spirochaetaceae bacterium]|jgi:peptidoglycan/xylan/chitin deacetylase (PgdA/CDA1 family)|nr:polysaccharide deacetylase [Spirochaetaceae bacterium]